MTGGTGGGFNAYDPAPLNVNFATSLQWEESRTWLLDTSTTTWTWTRVPFPVTDFTRMSPDTQVRARLVFLFLECLYLA